VEKEIFVGDHMKNVYKPKMNESSLGGLKGFVKV